MIPLPDTCPCGFTCVGSQLVRNTTLSSQRSEAKHWLGCRYSTVTSTSIGRTTGLASSGPVWWKSRQPMEMRAKARSSL